MDTYTEHGISIGISRVNGYFFMKIKINGMLTHNDYQLMVPMLRNAIKDVKEPKVNVLVDGTEFSGFELRAAWDDFKFGIEFNNIFNKIAYIGTASWERYGVKIGSWFMNGDIKFFSSSEQAYEWLNKEEITPITPVQKDLHNRKNAIRDDLEFLFKSNMRITDVNVPEPDDQDASEILVDILEEKLLEIKNDVKNGKYQDY